MCIIDPSVRAELALRKRAAKADDKAEADRLVSAADLLERRRENSRKLAERQSRLYWSDQR